MKKPVNGEPVADKMRMFDLRVNRDQLQVILNSLGNMPYTQAAPLLDLLAKQIGKQGGM